MLLTMLKLTFIKTVLVKLNYITCVVASAKVTKTVISIKVTLGALAATGTKVIIVIILSVKFAVKLIVKTIKNNSLGALAAAGTRVIVVVILSIKFAIKVVVKTTKVNSLS